MGQLTWQGPGAFWEVPNYGTVQKGQTITLPDSLCNQLYAQDMSWWLPAGGFVPSTPPAVAPVQPMGGYAGLWNTNLIYRAGYVVVDAAARAWIALLDNVGEPPVSGSTFWTPLTLIAGGLQQDTSYGTGGDVASQDPVGGGARRRVPLADRVVWDVREFVADSVSYPPTDGLGYIQDAMNKVQVAGGVVLIPDIPEPLVVSEGIVTQWNSRMMGPSGWNIFSQRSGSGFASAAPPASGAGIGNLWPEPPNAFGEAWVRLANGVNGPLITNGQLGPQDPNGGYWEWFWAAGINFDHNGQNQTGTPGCIVVTDAWGWNLYNCRFTVARGRGAAFLDCNACNTNNLYGVGSSEQLANGNADLTNGSPILVNATGTWTKGKFISHPSITPGAYVGSVVGTTVTLAAGFTVTGATAANQPMTTTHYFMTDGLYLGNTTTDCAHIGASIHGSSVASLHLDSAYGCTVGDSLFGYTLCDPGLAPQLGGYNVWLSDSFGTGCYLNKLDFRGDQATKHVVRADQGSHGNVIVLNGMSPGMFGAPADSDGGMVVAFDDGSANVWVGVGEKGPGTLAAASSVGAFGPNSGGSDGTSLKGGSDIGAIPRWAYRPVSSTSPGKTFSCKSGESPILIPFTEFVAVVGAAALTTFAPNGSSVNQHACLALPASVTTSLIAYIHLPYGNRLYQIEPQIVSLIANAGGASIVLEVAGSSHHLAGSTIIGTADDWTLGPTAVVPDPVVGQYLATDSFSGAEEALIPGQLVSVRVTRLGGNGSDTLAGVAGFLGLRIIPLDQV